MIRRTPLYNAHLAAGAKMVDFAGWEMPIHYGSQIEEHHAVRRDAGVFDVSHMLAIDLAGCEAQAFLRRLLANDVAKLTQAGKALYSCMLREDGGVIDDLIVYHFSTSRYRLVVNAATADKDLAWLRLIAADYAVGITARRDLAMLAIQGPQARARFWQAFPEACAQSDALAIFQATEWGDGLLARTGYTGEDGFEISIPAALACEAWERLLAAGVKPCGLGARDTLRLEAGMNLYGQDMDETVTPLESGLAWTVDFRDSARRFIGREALETQLAAGQLRQFLGLVLLERGVLRAHQPVITAHGRGETTSGSFSPTLNRAIALARLPYGTVPGEIVAVEIRDKKMSAKVVKPPFVRHGKPLIEE